MLRNKRILPQWPLGIRLLLHQWIGIAVMWIIPAYGLQAGELEQAKRIHDRIAGVPPTEGVLVRMKDHLENGEGRRAVDLAMAHDGFYNTTLKNWISPWTNEDQTPFVPLNDYTATAIGLIRDGDDFRKVLYDDVLYVGEGVSPAYANDNNSHYQALESGGFSLKDTLTKQSQASMTGLPGDATSGVMTTRAAARAFFKAGTNRAQFRFTLVNYLCRDLEQVHDITRVPDRIRQDVSRSPGGDSRVFMNGCLGCHSGMDPMTQAYAYYDYLYDVESDLTGANGQIVYNAAGQTDATTGTRVVAKYHINASTFLYGFVTPDDRWDNYWRAGVNAQLGWDSALPGSGNGARSMNKELAHSEAFAQCQVEKVFRAICFRGAENSADRLQIQNMVTQFKSDNYDLRTVFSDAALYCRGD